MSIMVAPISDYSGESSRRSAVLEEPLLTANNPTATNLSTVVNRTRSASGNPRQPASSRHSDVTPTPATRHKLELARRPTPYSNERAGMTEEKIVDGPPPAATSSGNGTAAEVKPKSAASERGGVGTIERLELPDLDWFDDPDLVHITRADPPADRPLCGRFVPERPMPRRNGRLIDLDYCPVCVEALAGLCRVEPRDLYVAGTQFHIHRTLA